jgi:hypothetical protein
MRHNQNRRSRGRSRKGPNPLSRSYESNGPDVKVRGTAAHVAEKYMSLARDAHAAGDVVAAENYLQHAEHYNRIVMAAQAQFQQSQPQFREGGEEGYDDDRQMNGRGRDRFEYNGENRGGEEEGEDRFEPGEAGDEERGFRPMQQRPHEQQGDRPRGPRDRFDRRDRPDYRDNRDNRDRPDRFQREDQPQPDIAPPQASAAPIADEGQSQPRRRRGRPQRGEGAEGQDGDDATPDGAAALAAFPD